MTAPEQCEPILVIHSEDDRRRIAWTNAPQDLSQDPSVQRNDHCGHPILWSEYENSDSQFGWYVELVDDSESLDFSSNLRAVNYRSSVRPE